MIEEAVWLEVKKLLNNPSRIKHEYEKRILKSDKALIDCEVEALRNQAKKISIGISRLIDSYTDSCINKDEFEPRIKVMKNNLEDINKQKAIIQDQNNIEESINVTINTLESFKANIKDSCEQIDWITKRDIIRSLVKKVEIHLDDINIIYRINEIKSSSGMIGEKPLDNNSKSLQHCPLSI